MIKRPRFYYGWVIVVVMALAGFTQSAETFNVLGVFFKPITQEFGWSRGDFAGAVGIGSLLGGVVALFVGPLLDRFGPRWALVIALGMLGVVYVSMAEMTTLWQLYVLQIMGRMLNLGVLGIAAGVVIPKWFILKRGRAVAMASIGVNAGAVVLPLGAQFLIDVWSWRVAAVGVAVILWTVSLLPAALFLRRQPEDIGLLPDGARNQEQQGQGSGPTSGPRAGKASQERSFALHEAYRLWPFYLLTLAMALGWLVRTGVTLNLIPYLTDRGLSPNLAVVIVALQAATGAVGALASGFLSERFNARWALVLDFAMIAGGLAWLLLVRSAPMAVAWSMVWGFCFGGIMALQPVIYANYFGRHHLGSIQGVARAAQTVTQAAGPFVAAFAYDATGTYIPAFVAFGVAAVLAALSVALASAPARRTPMVAATA